MLALCESATVVNPSPALTALAERIRLGNRAAGAAVEIPRRISPCACSPC